MRNAIRYSILAALIIATALAQTSPTSTTLSTAVTTTYNTTVVVASGTGIGVGTYLYVDREALSVTAVSGGRLSVVRGAMGTRASTHASGAPVTFGPAAYMLRYDPAGSCVSTAQPVLPVINVTTGQEFNCLGSMWVNTSQGTGPIRTCYVKYDFAADGGVIGTITPKVANCTIPKNSIITKVWVNSTTAVTSGGLATVSIGTSAGSSTTALLGATAKASLSLNAVMNGVPVMDTSATWVKLSAAGKVTCTVAVADLTAGVIEIWVMYLPASA